VHILVVEDNAINQQIATKTIRKLGFQVSAVWNGKEALDYVTAAEKGSKKRPDIILMDVQMPVIDGYKCTHLLRHHMPYKDYVSGIPIVAMTASAIQGDKEKCKRAGMDDYLAKPVKSKTLERMLVRWLKSKRVITSPADGSAFSDCSEAGEQCENSGIPGIGLDDDDDDADTNADATPMIMVDHGEDDADEKRSFPTPRPHSSAERNDHFPGYALSPPPPPADVRRRSGDFGGDVMELETSPPPLPPPPAPGQPRDMNMEPVHPMITDERAIHSRDDKLFNAAGGAADHLLTSPMLQPTGDFLTEENVGRLQDESMHM